MRNDRMDWPAFSWVDFVSGKTEGMRASSSTPKLIADCRYRAKVPWQAVTQALHGQAMAVDYTNFKSTAKARKHHDACAGVWLAMHVGQER